MQQRLQGYIESYTAAINFAKLGYKFQTIVEYTVPKDVTDDFIEVISRSPFIVSFTQINRHVEIGTRHSQFIVMYAHKSKEMFLHRMKTVLESVPYNVEYRIYEVTRIIKKLPTIELSLEDIVNK